LPSCSSIALELNTKIWYCSQIIRGENAPVSKALAFGVAGMRRFFNPAGLLVILYVGLIVPIAGFGLSISLTSRIYTPSFITSVITSTPLYLAIYAVVVVCLVVLGVLHAFVLHIVLLDRVDAREALTRSRQMVRQNLRSFLVQTLLFNLRCTLAAALLIFVAMVPAAVVYASGGPRVLLLFFVLSGAAVSSFASFLLDASKGKSCSLSS
jgi:glycerophosphoryl diester phosphodiesterase